MQTDADTAPHAIRRMIGSLQNRRRFVDQLAEVWKGENMMIRCHLLIENWAAVFDGLVAAHEPGVTPVIDFRELIEVVEIVDGKLRR